MRQMNEGFCGFQYPPIVCTKLTLALIGTLLSVASATGCDQDEPASTPGGGIVVGASPASLELGVQHWRVSADGSALGLDADGESVAEFHVDAAAGVVTSVLPDRGSAALGGSYDSLSGRSRTLYVALIGDLRAQVEGVARSEPESSGDGQAVDKWAIYGCYPLIYDCQLMELWGRMQGWWPYGVCQISYSTRPVCGNSFALLY